jgi:UbiD family decarboxylase
MEYNDLRGFISRVREIGELKLVEGADWDKELGAISEMMAERKGPALLFDQIKGYPKGYRVFSNPCASLKRTALVLGIPLDMKPLEMLDAWRRKLKYFKPLPPKEVKDAPVKENIRMGADINLFNFPSPIWHEQDGGRFLGTGCAVITKDPDEGWVNLGTHRCMIFDKNLLGVALLKGKHGRIMMDKYHSRGKSCPIAISIGQDPVLWMAASTPLVGWGTSEYEFAGWVRNEPVEVVKGEVTNLPIPASAEIVIEGEIPPQSETGFRTDGPFGEWIGHFSQATIPIVVVKSILHRNDPIILGTPPYRPPAPFQFVIPLEAGLVWNALENADIPSVTGVWYGLEAWGPLWLIVRIHQEYAGHSKQAALAACSCRAGCYGGKFVIVVDDDIDITNIEEVIWAIISRANVESMDIVHGLWTSGADLASVLPENKARGLTVNARAIIDACWPYSRIDQFPKTNRFSQTWREKILDKWSEVFSE